MGIFDCIKDQIVCSAMPFFGLVSGRLPGSVLKFGHRYCLFYELQIVSTIIASDSPLLSCLKSDFRYAPEVNSDIQRVLEDAAVKSSSIKEEMKIRKEKFKRDIAIFRKCTW